MLIDEVFVGAGVDVEVVPALFVDSFFVGGVGEFGVGGFEGDFEVGVDGVEGGVGEGG